jgi:hypothetical protein
MIAIICVLAVALGVTILIMASGGIHVIPPPTTTTIIITPTATPTAPVITPSITVITPPPGTTTPGENGTVTTIVAYYGPMVNYDQTGLLLGIIPVDALYRSRAVNPPTNGPLPDKMQYKIEWGIENITNQEIRNIEIHFILDGKEVGVTKVDALKPKEQYSFNLLIDVLPNTYSTLIVSVQKGGN